MIKGYEKLKIPDENKAQNIIAEVNWNVHDPKSMNCKLIRFSMGDKVAVVKKEHLMAVLFAIGNEEEQRKMIPTTTLRSRWYETVVSVKATKHIQKGEEITFPIKLSLPTQEDEQVAEMKRDLVEKGKVIIKT